MLPSFLFSNVFIGAFTLGLQSLHRLSLPRILLERRTSISSILTTLSSRTSVNSFALLIFLLENVPLPFIFCLPFPTSSRVSSVLCSNISPVLLPSYSRLSFHTLPKRLSRLSHHHLSQFTTFSPTVNISSLSICLEMFESLLP